MLSRILRLLFALAGLALFSQAPEFLQQYAQRIGGTVEEIQRDLSEHADSASRLGLTLDQAIERRKASDDPLVVDDGQRLERKRERAAVLGSQYETILNGSLWERLYIFAFGLDPALALATAEVYAPAVPLTAEGGIAAAIGFVGGWLVGWLALLPLSVLRRRLFRRHRRQEASTA